MAETIHLADFSIVKGDVTANIKLTRLDKNLRDAQFWLDGQVMHDMIPYMPMVDGNFIHTTESKSKALQGTGTVIAGTGPHGRFLYMGKVMVDPDTGSAWARKGVKKVVTDKPLQYFNAEHPDATDHWFEAAKERYGETWVKGVKKRAAGRR